ncbi:hypothetical protein AMJ80_09665 [bacterium SM23_31]|nr:MAG: hypothetical protein AMJ80_09665 [bacterium SM23_31]
MIFKSGSGFQSIHFAPGRILLAYNIAAALLIFVFSCRNPFATREPEPPAGQQATWVQPVSPEDVFENFKAAIKERNVENYLRCFGTTETVREGFIFVPEISVANNYQEVFTDWGIVEERNYINHLFNLLPADSVSSLILTDVSEFQYGDSVRTTKEYDLVAAHKNPTAPKEIIGRMDLSLRKGPNALWYIAYWADFKTADYPVWSLLKAEF